MFKIGNVDFGDVDIVESLDITYVTSFKNTQIKFYIDTVDEDYLIATFNCGTDVDSTWSKKLTKTVDVNRRIQGLHDVYVVYSNNACSMFDLKFN